MYTDEYFMGVALQEARRAYEFGEVPVGAVVVVGNQIIVKGYNQIEQLKDATAHAEMLALTAACNHIGGKYLSSCTLYVTLEPCLMCSGAIYWTQLGRLVFGANDDKRGYRLLANTPLHPRTQVESGVLALQSSQLLACFFKKIRSPIL